MRPYLRYAAIVAAFIVTMLVPSIHAQGLYGSLVGNITDPSPASIPGAKVKITHVETNQIRETLTTADGTYMFPTIPPGTYEIEVSRPGFQTFTRKEIPVTINTTVRVDATLQVGATTQSVEVSGQTALLQTDRADIRSDFTTNSLSNLSPWAYGPPKVMKTRSTRSKE